MSGNLFSKITTKNFQTVIENINRQTIRRDFGGYNTLNNNKCLKVLEI